MSQKHQKKIAVINDFCGFGRCSLTVSVPVISAMKIMCCPLPTAIFSNHTGYESFFRTDYTGSMNDYINQWEKLGLSFDGILSGFLGSPEQIEIVCGFFEKFKRSDTVIVVDPVMGDEGRLYSSFSPVLADKMKLLLPYADILTPNLTECCMLAGKAYSEEITDDGLYELCRILSRSGPKKIIVTGLNSGDDLENYVFEEGKDPRRVTEHRVGCSRSGTGDVFSSIIAADAVNGLDLTESVRHASSFIAKALRKTVELGLPPTDGICFEEYLKEI